MEVGRWYRIVLYENKPAFGFDRCQLSSIDVHGYWFQFRHLTFARPAMFFLAPSGLQGLVVIDLDRAVQGWPEGVLTAALLAVGVFCFYVALSDHAGLKGIVVAWMVLP